MFVLDQGRILLAGVLAAVMLLTLAPHQAAAYRSSTNRSQDIGAIQAKLKQDQAELARLDEELKATQARLDTLNRQLDADRVRQAQLEQQIANLARLEYQQPLFRLDSLLAARSLDQLLGDLAQARLVSGKQKDLLAQATALRQADEQARDKVAEQVNQIKTARGKAAQVAEEALSVRDTALLAQARTVVTQASALACDPNQPAPAGCPADSIQRIIVGAFAPLGQTAVDWGLRIAKCESGYNPRAVNPSGASGLFQFMPSTFAHTPQGLAGGSIWDPVAQSQAAAWMYTQGRQAEWQCR